MAERYVQKYRKAWESDPLFKKWIRPFEKDETKALCIYCKCQIGAKRSDLIRHTNREKHQKALKPFNGTELRQPEIQFTINVTEKQKIQAMLALYVAVHSSILSVDHLGAICNAAFKDSKAASFSLHRTKCTNIITNVLAPHFINNLLKDLNNSYFSLILDEGTDISVEKLLGVVIRYYSAANKKFVTTFLGLIDVEGGKADDLLKGLERLAILFNIDLKKLLAIGTDNASVMTGSNNGLYRKIKDKYNLKNLILIRCVCHSLQLAVCSATDKHFPANINFLVKESHNWFSNSAVRQKTFTKIYKLINCDSATNKKIPMTAPTRWLSIEKAVKTILNMWLELRTHFNIVNDKSYETSQLRSMYNDSTNLVYITYLATVLAEVQRVNLAFESQNADHTKLFDDLYRLLKSLTNRIIIPVENFDYLEGNIDSVLNEHSYLGYNFEKVCRENKIQNSEKELIQKNLIIFTKTLIYEIRSKLPSNIKVLKNISLFSVNNIILNNTQDIITFIKEFIECTKEIEEMENCLNNLKLCRWKNRDETEAFWIEVHNFKNSVNETPFEKLSMFVINLLSFPFSNAEVERSFSVMNLYKSKIGNRMSLNTVNSLIHIKYGLRMENTCCENYSIPSNVCANINNNNTYKKSKYYIKTVLWPEDECGSMNESIICLEDELF